MRLKPILVNDDKLELHVESDVAFENMEDYDLLRNFCFERGIDIIAYSTKFSNNE